MDYKVKDRSAKVARRKSRMPVNGKSVFTILAVEAKRAQADKERPSRTGRGSYVPTTDHPHACGVTRVR